MAASAPTLDEIRAEIDRIDQAVHDLLMRRVDVVRDVGRLKGASAPKWRPAREAALVRRLVARHKGEMPVQVLVRIWREMIIGGSLALQEKVTVAVFDDSGCWDLARDHFGAMVPLKARPSAGQIVREVAAGKATIGVLPSPADGEAEPWWPLLMRRTSSSLRIVVKLPFAGPANGRSAGEALTIARVAFEPSGSDNSLIVVEVTPELSRASLMAAIRKADLHARWLARQDSDEHPTHLLEVDGFVGDGDARLAALREDPRLRRVASIGGYALPLARS
jgi:chorismate mutase/prephenate dehydratase